MKTSVLIVSTGGKWFILVVANNGRIKRYGPFPSEKHAKMAAKFMGGK